MSIRPLAALFALSISACSGDPSSEPEPPVPPIPPPPPREVETPCTAGRCPGAVKITFGTQRCALLRDTSVRCSAPGDLFEPPADSTPLEVVLEGAVDLVAGEQHACALLADETVQCWGDNRWGAL